MRSGGSLAAYAARRGLTVVAVVVLAPSVTFVFAAMLRDGRSIGQALAGLRTYLDRVVLHGDLGTVTVNGIVMPVRRVMIEGLPVDLGLVAGGLLIGTVLGVGIALLQGPGRGSPADHAYGLGSAAALSVPVLPAGLMCIVLFGHTGGIRPLAFIADGGDYQQPWVQPLHYLRTIGTAATIIALPLAAAVYRMTRAALREAADARHVETARAKGLREARVRRRHILPTAAPPVVALIGVNLSALVFNAVLIEVPYNMPGGFRLAHFGQYLDEVHSHLPEPAALQAVVLECALIVSLAMVACDVLAARLDPRLRDT
jgi:peptide/nickel transport system permease protein